MSSVMERLRETVLRVPNAVDDMLLDGELDAEFEPASWAFPLTVGDARALLALCEAAAALDELMIRVLVHQEPGSGVLAAAAHSGLRAALARLTAPDAGTGGSSG